MNAELQVHKHMPEPRVRKHRIVVYVAGPYRDSRGMYYVDRNVNEAREVACQLWSWDYAVICPHTNTRFMDGYDGIKIDAFLEGLIDIMERADIVVMMPRWRTSEGSRAEYERAKELGIPVFFWADDKDQEFLEQLGYRFLEDPSILVHALCTRNADS
jgi:hypothetical protein